MNQLFHIPISSALVGAATRSDLLRAARTLFAKKGFDGTSVRAITRLADANLGAITYHFGTKRDLYSAVLEAGLRPLLANVISAAESEGSGLERLLCVVEAYFEHFEDHPDLPHLLLQEIAAGKEPPDVVREILGRVKQLIGGLHIEGVEDGSVRPGHPVLSALSVVSQPVYLTLAAPLLKTVGDIDLSDRETRRMVLDHTLTFVRAGLQP